MEEIANYVRSIVKCNVDVREGFFRHFLKHEHIDDVAGKIASTKVLDPRKPFVKRSEEHTSELQSHSEISYAVFCLKKKKKK